jgi:hypothetical protein
MIPEKTGQVVISSSSFASSKSKIVTNSYIKGILRSGIYSDKILACVRELSCNAYDAHISAGIKDTPIEIYVPTVLNPSFKVRDYGAGLDDYGIREILFSYGDPTGLNEKVDSNEQHGMFHIGAKAPFSYSSVFEVASIKDGIKRIYCCYIGEDEDDYIDLINESFTEEPSGLEITIPVKKDDINSFCYTIKNFFVFWDIKPLFKNVEIKFENNQGIKSLFKNSNFYVWSPSYSRAQSKLICSGVQYNISENFHSSKRTPYLSYLIERGFIFNAKIGDVTFSSSRENVAETDRSLKFLENETDKVFQSIYLLINKELESDTDKLSFLGKFINLENELGQVFFRYFDQNKLYFKFNNEIIQTDFLKPNIYLPFESFGFYYYSYDERLRKESRFTNLSSIEKSNKEISSRSIKNEIGKVISFSRNHNIILIKPDDLKNTRETNLRIRKYLELNNKSDFCNALVFRDESTYNLFFDNSSIKPSDIVNISDIEPLVIKKAFNYQKILKTQIKVGVMDASARFSFVYNEKDLKNGYYVFQDKPSTSVYLPHYTSYPYSSYDLAHLLEDGENLYFVPNKEKYKKLLTRYPKIENVETLIRKSETDLENKLNGDYFYAENIICQNRLYICNYICEYFDKKLVVINEKYKFAYKILSKTGKYENKSIDYLFYNHLEKVSPLIKKFLAQGSFLDKEIINDIKQILESKKKTEKTK